jgi:hypothetical protein
MHARILASLLMAAVLWPSAPLAQTHTPGESHPISVLFDGGFAAGSPGSGPAIGARLTWDVTPRLALELAGAWAGRGGGTDTGTLAAQALVNLTDTERKMVPYAAIGGGWYGAMFDMDDRRYFGAMGAEYAGMHVVPLPGMHGVGMLSGYPGAPGWAGPWSGPVWDVSGMPMFYLERMGIMQVPADGRWGRHMFGDPALAAGGGVRVAVSERVYVRPEVRALVAFSGGRSFTTTLVTFGIGYRF